LLVATLAQVYVLTADASAGTVKLAAKVFSAQTGAPVEGVTLLAFALSPNGKDPNGKPLARATTDKNGRFTLLLPGTTALVNVRITLVPPLNDPCGDLRLIGIVGAATSEAARDRSRVGGPSGSPPINRSTDPSTFEPIGPIPTDDPCGWKMGAAGLYRHRDLE
jgi:hypothetical protein